jgi:hypothetical protein
MHSALGGKGTSCDLLALPRLFGSFLWMPNPQRGHPSQAGATTMHSALNCSLGES